MMSENILEKNRNQWRYVFAVWALYSGYVFLRWDAPVQDEIWFLGFAKELNPISAYITQPRFGYGQLYWAALSILDIYGARIISVAAMISTPLAIMATSKTKMPILLFWLSMPAAWWTGKLIGPELWTLALCALAVMFFHQNKYAAAGMSAGLAIGLKLNSIPITVFIGVLILLERRGLRAVLEFGITTTIGAILAYPLVLWAEPTEVKYGASGLLETLTNMAVERIEWDGAYSGGIFTFGIAVVPLLLLFFFGGWKRHREAIALLASFLTMSLMLTASRTQYGWYVLPFIPPALYLFGRMSDFLSLRLKAVTTLIIFCNLAAQYPAIAYMIHQKSEQLSFLSNKEAASCISSNLSALPPGTKTLIVAEFGYSFSIPQSLVIISSDKAESAEVIVVMQRLMKAPFFRNLAIGKTLAADCGGALFFK